MVEVYAVKIIGDDQYREIRDDLLSILPQNRQTRIRRFRKPTDAQRSLFGEVMVRRIISEKSKIPAGKIAFELGPHGKPSLHGSNDLHFSISHSGEWIVSALSRSSVGIDIEKVGPPKIDVAKRFFSEHEYTALMARPEEERDSFFFELWTLKESYVKLLGTGISTPLSSFTIEINDGVAGLAKNPQSRPVYFRQYVIEETYKMAVCAREPDFIREAAHLSVDELLDHGSMALRTENHPMGV